MRKALPHPQRTAAADEQGTVSVPRTDRRESHVPLYGSVIRIARVDGQRPLHQWIYGFRNLDGHLFRRGAHRNRAIDIKFTGIAVHCVEHGISANCQRIELQCKARIDRRVCAVQELHGGERLVRNESTALFDEELPVWSRERSVERDDLPRFLDKVHCRATRRCGERRSLRFGDKPFAGDCQRGRIGYRPACEIKRSTFGNLDIPVNRQSAIILHLQGRESCHGKIPLHGHRAAIYRQCDAGLVFMPVPMRKRRTANRAAVQHKRVRARRIAEQAAKRDRRILHSQRSIRPPQADDPRRVRKHGSIAYGHRRIP